jgi:hypothetical protein
MKKSQLLTITGGYWHFHPLGTGTIFTYHTQAKQIIITCVATGTIINTVDKYEQGGYKTPQEFREDAIDVYLGLVEDADVSMDLSFYDNPTYIGECMVEVDFDLIKN